MCSHRAVWSDNYCGDDDLVTLFETHGSHGYGFDYRSFRTSTRDAHRLISNSNNDQTMACSWDQ